MTKRAAVISAVLAATIALAGCNTDKRIECDKGDYAARDLDCGYVNSSNQWVYYDWTKPDQTTFSPEGWQPPAEANVQEDGNSGKLKKRKK